MSPLSALVSLDTGGSGVVSPDREKSRAFADCCTKGVWLQWNSGMSERLNVRTSEDRGVPPPIPWMNMKRKGLQNGFPEVHEGKWDSEGEVSSKMGVVG